MQMTRWLVRRICRAVLDGLRSLLSVADLLRSLRGTGAVTAALILLPLANVEGVAAQRALLSEEGPAGLSLEVPPYPSLDTRMVASRIQHSTILSEETEWLRGGLVGAVGLSLVAIVIGASFDGHRDTGFTTGEFLRAAGYGAAIGFGIGALIGGQFGK